MSSPVAIDPPGLRAVFQALREGVIVFDRAGNLLMANPIAATTLGFGASDPTPPSIGELEPGFRVLGLDNEPVPQSEWPVQRVLRGESLVDLHLRMHRRSSGEGAIISFSGHPVRDEHGDITMAVLTFRDVTERHRLSEELVRSERRFRELIEKSSDMFLLLDAGFRIQFASPSVSYQSGWSREELIGRSVLDFLVVGPDDPPLDNALVSSGPDRLVRSVRRFRRRDGTIGIADLVARNFSDDPAIGGIIVNLRDVTEQRSLEEQFRQAQKLESVGRLAGGVAHDFNNLLTVMFSCIDLMRDDIARGALPSLDDLELIRGASERGRGLTQQLLAFARKQVIAPVALDLNELVRGTERMLGRILGEDVEVEVATAPALWTVLADPGQVEQVVLNLAVNARDAMPHGGRLRLETRNLTVHNDGAPAPAGQGPGEWVCLSVIDNGSGMTEEVRQHIFEPFFTTKEKGRGTGLGLATVYGIVHQAGGHILVSSELGQGTTFRVCLPRHLRVAEEAAPRPAATERGGNETILLAEDDLAVRRLVVRLLRGAGYRVLEAASGHEAIEIAAREEGGLDLVVTDVVMPGLDGRSVADAVGRLRAGIPVLYVSGYSHDILGRHGVLEPGIELLPKPFTAAALLDRVRRLLDRS